jgi:UDP-3-O-[3-hydroxymyristoyl] N-acetylglucosamine deacetylase
MRKTGQRCQRTIEHPCLVTGVGYFTGADLQVRFVPAPEDTGIIFRRTDLRNKPVLPATVTSVTGANRRTTLGQSPGRIDMVEHVLSALAGLRIDNCEVELNGPELPGLDGSALAYVRALQAAGIETQNAEKDIWGTEVPITVVDAQATLTLYPDFGDGFKVSYILDYGNFSPLGIQRHTHEVTPTAFGDGLADCRTFLMQEEAEALRAQGIGQRTQFGDVLVIGPRGPVGNYLRYADEPARHKCLDIIGDLSLFGHDLSGHVVGYRSGHALNVRLVRRLHQLIVWRDVKPQRLAA